MGIARIPVIGVVLPAFNEARVIGKVIDEIPSRVIVRGKPYQLKIIVVNDGSSDSTAKIVSRKKRVVLINHIINSGAGAATRTGLHYARNLGCNYAITMDSDGQHSVKDVIKLAKLIIRDKNVDLLIGSRLKSRGGNMPLIKRLGNIGLGIITLCLLGVYASDTQSGLKAFNKKALFNIEFHSNDYAFCSELIWKAHQSKLRIKEVPIKAIYTDYSISRGQKNLGGGLDIVRQLIKRRLLHFING